MIININNLIINLYKKNFILNNTINKRLDYSIKYNLSDKHMKNQIENILLLNVKCEISKIAEKIISYYVYGEDI